MRRPLTCAAAAAASLLVALPAHAARFRPEDRETTLLSRSFLGGFPDGPSRNASIAGDYQLASAVAFESDATDLVAGDRNGTTDVFVTERRRPFSIEGEPWRRGRTRLVSRAANGGPANGPSTAPDVSGDRGHRARCVAFVSAASNLVAGDTNRVTDAFVHDFKTGRTRRVSLNSSGAQANGATSQVVVDGSCTRVAFVATATNLALTKTRRPGWRWARTSKAPAGTRQVYVRVLSDGRGRLGGLTFLASASTAGRAGGGDAYDASISRLSTGSTPGSEVAYAAEAKNLTTGDRNAYPDVYLTRFAGDRRHTGLVSRGRRGQAGNGPSDQPQVAAGGDYVAFHTSATDLLPADRNGVSDIARASTGRPGRFLWASRSQALGLPGDGVSSQPSVNQTGTVVAFASEATNLQATVRNRLFDRNWTGDIFFFSALSRNVSLQSRDSANEIPNQAEHGYPPGDSRYDHLPHPPAANPDLSYYANYLTFDSSYPLLDLDAARHHFPGLTPRDAARLANDQPALRQVYLRYIGPR